MPLQEQLFNMRATIDEGDLSKRLVQLFGRTDKKIRELSVARRLPLAQVRFLQPLHRTVLAGDETIFVVLSVHDLGGIPSSQDIDWSGKPMNLDDAKFLAERDLGFRDPFGFQFPRVVLELDEGKMGNAISQIAENCIKDEVDRIERLDRIVKINPIFHGRDFLLDQNLVFALMPFEDPFDAIFEDHIRPSVESIHGFRCLRADDIYDNRPIIEDIWRYTNEARLLIAELTGKNANVFYETGIAHAIGKEVVLITQSMDDVPFDLQHLRCIVYEYNPRGTPLLEQNLVNTIQNIVTRR